MTQSSIFWPTSGVGDGASQYTDAQLFAWLRRTFARSISTEGVHAGYANELAVSGAASPISINTGAGLVDGIPYENTAAVSLAIATPAVGTTGHRIVLRASWAAQTVRVVDIASADGVAAIPAATQTPGTTYDITLATLTITTGGVITLTDARSYLHYTGKVSTVMLDDEAVTPAKIANRTRTLFIPVSGGFNNTDSVVPTLHTTAGLYMPDTKSVDAFGHVYVPADFVSLTNIKAVLQADGAGNIYSRHIGYYNAVGFTYNGNPAEQQGPAAIAVAGNVMVELQALTLPFLLANYYIQLSFRRDATSVLDTINTGVNFIGWLMTYTADS